MREVIFFCLLLTQLFGHSQIKGGDEFYQVRDQILDLGEYADESILDSLYRKAFRLGQPSDLHGELAQLLVMYGARHIGVVPNLDTCYYYLKKAEKLSEEEKFYRSLAKSQIYLAHNYNIIGEQIKSVNYIQEAKVNVQKVRDDKIKLNLSAFIASLAGDIFKSFNLYDSALDNYQKAIEIASANQALKVELKALNQLGSLYLAYGENKLARQLYHRVIQMSELDDKGSYKASARHNLADIYFIEDDLDSALLYYRMAFALREEQKRPSMMMATSLAKIHVRFNQPDSGLYYLSLLDTTHLTGMDRHHLLSTIAFAQLRLPFLSGLLC